MVKERLFLRITSFPVVKDNCQAELFVVETVRKNNSPRGMFSNQGDVDALAESGATWSKKKQ